jgi:hypothetical protein
MKQGLSLATLFFSLEAPLFRNAKKKLALVGVLVKPKSKQLMNVRRASNGYVISWRILTCFLRCLHQFSTTTKQPLSGQILQAQKACVTTTFVKMSCAKQSMNIMKSLCIMLVVRPILLISSQKSTSLLKFFGLYVILSCLAARLGGVGTEVPIVRG